MKSKLRKNLLYVMSFFLKELNYVNSEDIIGIGKYKFLTQFIKSKLQGRKGIYALIPSSSTIIDSKNITIKGELKNSNLIRSLISSRLYIQAINGIQFDSSLLIGPDVKIISANHDFNNYDNWYKSSPIIIKKNVWIGANAIILPGVVIGNSCIIGAGSVVTKSFEDNCVIAGSPARIISKRN